MHGTVTGRVQGVGFRDFVRREAASRGITGYVRNTDDGGGVEFVAEGEEPELDALLTRLREGPRFARVADVHFAYSDATGGFGRFSVEM